MDIRDVTENLVLDGFKSRFISFFKRKNEAYSVRKAIEAFFTFIEPIDRRESLVDEIIRDFDSYANERSMELVYDRIKRSLKDYEITEEGYALFLLCLYSKYSSNNASEIENFLRGKKLEENFSEFNSLINNGIKSIVDLINEREKNQPCIGYTIDEAELNICYETDGRLDLDFFNLGDFIFENEFNQALSQYKVVEVYSGCRKETLYFVLFLLQSKKDIVRIVDSKEKYRNYTPESDNIILVTNFSDVIEEERMPRCKVIRLHDRTVRPDEEAKNKIVLSPRKNSNLRNALMRVFGNDRERVNKLLEKTGGYYSLIEAELDSIQKNCAWTKVMQYDQDFGKLEEFLFIESFDDEGMRFLSSIGIDAEGILESADRIDDKYYTSIPFHSENTYELWGKVHHEYKVNSPDKVWKHVHNIDKKLSEKFLSYSKKVLESEEKVNTEILQNLIYSTIRHQADIGYDQYEKIIGMTFSMLSGSLLEKNRILPAIAELSPSMMLEWLKINPEEVNDDNVDTIFLLLNTEETAEDTIDLVVERCKTGDVEAHSKIGISIYNLLKEVFQPYNRTTILSVGKIIDTIESVPEVDLFRKSFECVLPSKVGGCWLNTNARYKYRSFDDSYNTERSREEKELIIKALFRWIIRCCDLEGLIRMIDNRACLFFVPSEVFLSAMERVTKNLSDVEKYNIYCSIIFCIEEAITKNYPTEIQNTIKKARNCVIPSSNMLRILPEVSLSFKAYRRKKDWNEVEKENENSLFYTAVENNVTKDEYLSSANFLDKDISFGNEYTNVFFRLFGYKDIDIELIYSLPPNQQIKFLSHIKNNNLQLFKELLSGLTQDILFSLVCSESYENSKELLHLLCDEKQKDYWGRFNIFCINSNDKQEIDFVVKNCLDAGSYGSAVDLLSMKCDLYSGKELFAILKNSKKKYYYSVNYDLETDRVFSKIREASYNGDILEKDVIELEFKILNTKDLCSPNSFFTRCFIRQPDIYVYVFKMIYKSEDGKKKNLSNDEFKYWYQLYLELVYCPESPINGTSYNNGILKWFDDFVGLLEKQNQSSIAYLGIARLLAFAPSSFDSIMPDKAAEVIEVYSKKNYDLLFNLKIEISNRRGCHTFDDGVSSYRYFLAFKSYSENFKKKNLKKTAELYEFLSEDFKKQSKDERNQMELI